MLLEVWFCCRRDTIERPPQLVCPLEIRGVDYSVHLQEGRETKCSRGTRECGDLQPNKQLKGLQYKCEQKRRIKLN